MFRGAVLEIANSGLFGMIALVILLAVFVGVLIWVVRIDKQTIDELGRLPLDSHDRAEREEVYHA